MSSVYDVFADKYIDEKDIDLNAPPERYRKITEDLLVHNAARWFVNAYLEDKNETVQNNP